MKLIEILKIVQKIISFFFFYFDMEETSTCLFFIMK